jgi:hypothetical protein
MIQYRRGLISLSLAISLSASVVAGPAIGVASTRGTMAVNTASVRGTANISNGASVQTNETTGQIQLNNGTRVTLGQNTSATVFDNRLDLLQGAGQISGRGYGIEALGFRVEGSQKSVTTRVVYDQNRILVTALDGAASVSRAGSLLARLNPGVTYFFEPDRSHDGTAVSAGSTTTPGNGNGSGSGKGSGQGAVKTGLSTAAKWGIAAGVAGAGTAVGLGLSLTGDSASR